MDPLTQWWTEEDTVCVALRCVSQTPVLTVGGALDRRAARSCRRALEAALRARPRRLLVDLTSVTSSDASTAAALLDAMRRTAAWHGADVWLAGLPEPVRVVLDRVGLLPVFSVSRTTVRAIEEIRRLDHPVPRTA